MSVFSLVLVPLWQRTERHRQSSEAEWKFYLNTLQERKGQSQGRQRPRAFRGCLFILTLPEWHFFDWQDLVIWLTALVITPIPLDAHVYSQNAHRWVGGKNQNFILIRLWWRVVWSVLVQLHPLGPVWPGPNRQEVISLQNLCCLHMGLPTWGVLGHFPFLEPHLLLPLLLMSIFLLNINIKGNIIMLPE